MSDFQLVPPGLCVEGCGRPQKSGRYQSVRCEECQEERTRQKRRDKDKADRGSRPAGNGSKWIRPRKRQAIYRRDGEACVWCGSKLFLALDHYRPHARGGDNEAGNLVTSCRSCNSRRGDRSAPAFARAVARITGETAEAILARVNRLRRRALTRYLDQAA